jgi:hypothetical protein
MCTRFRPWPAEAHVTARQRLSFSPHMRPPLREQAVEDSEQPRDEAKSE